MERQNITTLLESKRVDAEAPKLNPDLGHVGQVIFASDGRARALVWEGRRRTVIGDAAIQLSVGAAARRANLYIDPTTGELFDEARRLLGRIE